MGKGVSGSRTMRMPVCCMGLADMLGLKVVFFCFTNSSSMRGRVSRLMVGCGGSPWGRVSYRSGPGGEDFCSLVIPPAPSCHPPPFRAPSLLPARVNGIPKGIEIPADLGPGARISSRWMIPRLLLPARGGGSPTGQGTRGGPHQLDPLSFQGGFATIPFPTHRQQHNHPRCT